MGAGSITADLREAALADIAEHLRTEGPQNWHKVRDRYSDVPEPTWWRWVRKAKKAAASPGDLKKASESAKKRARPDTIKDQVGKAKAALPVAPSPDYLAKAGAVGEMNLDFLQALNELYDDAKMIREHSMADGRIRNLRGFSVSVRLRNDLLTTALKAVSEVWELRRVHQFHEIIIQAIEEADPETAAKIIERMRAVSTEFGMSLMDAKV